MSFFSQIQEFLRYSRYPFVFPFVSTISFQHGDVALLPHGQKPFPSLLSPDPPALLPLCPSSLLLLISFTLDYQLNVGSMPLPAL